MILLPLLVGCSGSAPDPAAPLADVTLQREANAGRLAYELERDEEAVTQYRAALTRAQERDDLEAIGDIGYNLTVVELRANTPERTLVDARATRAELERRGVEPFPALLLAEATALYRTGAVAEADRAAQPIQRAGDVDAAARATFLRGLIADERGDERGLTAATAAVDALNAEKTPALEADFAELAARLALRRSDSAHARQKAARAAELRQEALDYRGLARALAVEAVAAERAGDEAAADLFLRAGRSAAAQATRPARVCGSGARRTLPLAVRSGAAQSLRSVNQANE